MSARDAQVLVGAESTPGTAEALVAGDAIDFVSCTAEDGGPGPVDREAVRAHMDTLAPYTPPSGYWRGQLVTELKAGADADGPLEIDPLLLAAGFLRTTVTDTSVTYNLDESPLGANAAAVNDDVRVACTLRKEQAPDGAGKHFIAAGCKFSLRIEGSVDRPPRLTWGYVGKYVTPTDANLTASATYDAGTPLAALKTSGTPFDLHGTSGLLLRSWSYDLGLEPVPRGNMGAGTGVGYGWPAVLRRARPGRLVLEVEEEDEAAFAAWAKYRAATVSDSNTIVYSDGTRDLTFTFRGAAFRRIPPGSGIPSVVRYELSTHRSGSSGSFSIAGT